MYTKSVERAIREHPQYRLPATHLSQARRGSGGRNIGPDRCLGRSSLGRHGIPSRPNGLRSTLARGCGRHQSLYLDRARRFTSIPAQATDFSHHTEITLQVIPKLKYSLRLLVDNEERELQRINNQTWEPAKPLYAPCLFDTCTC